MDVRRWMNERGIDPQVALDAGVRYRPGSNSILYPRRSSDGVRVGWKVRGIVSGRHSNDPPGIPIRDTIPFVAREGDGVLCICEGETDSLALATWHKLIPLEDPHVIAVPGANVFPNAWAGLYAGRQDVLLFPDADKAGEDLVQRVCGLIPRARVVRLPKGMDLSQALQEEMGSVIDGVAKAAYVPVQVPLRRSSFEYRQSDDIPRGLLVDMVVRDTRLKRRGGELVGLCPFHDEGTPSFFVNEERGVFKCHGCGRGGDAITYIREKHGVEYGEAFRIAKSFR